MDKKKTAGDYIRINLKNLGIDDMLVTGVLYYSDDETIANGIKFRDGEEVGRAEGLLSNFCSLGYYEMAKQFDVKPTSVSLHIRIEVGGKRIGFIRSDGDFDFEAAPSLRTALGWRIAIDGGRVRVIEFFGLDQAVSSLLDTIRTNGIGKRAFFNDYFAMLSILLVYMVMDAQFESLIYPFIVMFEIPLAFIGVGLALFIAGEPLSLPAFMGVIMLSGIVVNNAIVLIDYVNQLRKKGKSEFDALVEGGTTRLRPILMTSITTILGMVPMALATQEGSEMMRPMAIAMIGGLLVSTALTLVIIPVIL